MTEKNKKLEENIKRHLDYFAETVRKELGILSNMLFDISRKVDALNKRLESREEAKKRMSF
jgi:hypothetical protein